MKKNKKYSITIEFEDNQTKKPNVNNPPKKKMQKKRKQEKPSINENLFDSLFDKGGNDQNKKNKKKRRKERIDLKLKDEVEKQWKEKLCEQYGEKVVMGIESSSKVKPKLNQEETSEMKSKNENAEPDPSSSNNKGDESGNDEGNIQDQEIEDSNAENKGEIKTTNFIDEFLKIEKIDVDSNPFFNQDKEMPNCLIIEIPKEIKLTLMDCYEEIISKFSTLADFIFFTSHKKKKERKLSKIRIQKIHLSFDSEKDLHIESKKIKFEKSLPIFSENENLKNFDFITIKPKSISPLFTSTLPEIKKLPTALEIMKTKIINVEEINKANSGINFFFFF